ncbi:putative invertase inhibitor [Papaver somniferum]|uniref:putative invertase inhibitor n=1 Tax=Papaver somniferum TaxID=3469 RepID=UPI000E701AB1|nr:putative invertase inhibitor [Papaver somniferum]
MNQAFSLLSLSSIFIIFLVLNSFHDGVNGDLISNVCKNASTTDPNLKYDFCVASLSANPASKNAHDLLRLGLISMKTCLQKATSIHSYIAKMLKGGKGEPAAKPCLEDCLNSYTDAIRSVQKAAASFKIKDYNSANIQMSAAMDASTSCEDGFKEVVVGQDLTSPLAKQDGDFFQLAGISLAITRMV